MANILFAVFFSSCIIITFRLFSILKIDNLQAITINYFFAAILSFYTFNGNIEWISLASRSWLPWAVINGFLFILVFFVFARSAQKAGVAITAVASKMSVIIPVSIGLLIYGDNMNALKAIGILCAFPAFYLIFSGRENKQASSPAHTRYIWLPVLLFFGTGANDSVMKHAQMYYVGDEYLLFLGTIFAFSLVIGIAAWLFIFRGPKRLQLKNIIAGTILGIFNYASTMFFLRSLAIFESSVVFPIFNVSVVSMGALIGLLLFREKLLTKNWIGIVMAVITILLIAVAR